MAGKHLKEDKKRIDSFRVWAVLFTVVSIAFIGMLIYLDMLTVSLIVAAGVVVAVLAAVADYALFKHSSKGTKIAVTVLTVILTICYAIGIYYVGSTVSFLGNITKNDVQITEYNVVVKKSSPYKEVKDISGNTVTVYRDSTVQSDRAKELLKESVSVDFVSEKDINAICKSVTEDNNIIFITEAQYENAKDNIKDYKKDTRVIHTVKVKTDQKDISKGVDITNHPFNVYITGIDTSGSISKVSRSDVNMVVTVDPVEHRILMTSIPRDSYVALQGESHKGQMDKFTHTGIYGVEETVSTAEALLDVDINYYVKVNFTTVKELVNILGGIDINSEKAFRSKYGYYYEEGMNHVNGKEALAFARERYAFSNGDFQRNRNQQIVLEGIINKITSSSAVLTNYTEILSTISEYMSTNMSAKDIKKLVKMQLGDMRGWTIESTAITGTTGSSPCYSAGGANASVVYPDPESVEEASAKIRSYLDN